MPTELMPTVLVKARMHGESKQIYQKMILKEDDKQSVESVQIERFNYGKLNLIYQSLT